MHLASHSYLHVIFEQQVRILRHEKTLGLIAAKQTGGDAAKGWWPSNICGEGDNKHGIRITAASNIGHSTIKLHQRSHASCQHVSETCQCTKCHTACTGGSVRVLVHRAPLGDVIVFFDCHVLPRLGWEEAHHTTSLRERSSRGFCSVESFGFTELNQLKQQTCISCAFA
eukprot:6468865-Amphidinium_carterae.2